MKWNFVPQPLNLVETEVTERDQFRNDEVDLSDTIVREAVQNSLDAASGGAQVRVTFRWLNNSGESFKNFVDTLFDGQLEHARSAGIDFSDINFSEPSALVIEDFGTSGLTGSIDSKDDGNFSDFWRRHGRSHKTGKRLGRWGLGKLVYSSSSLLSTFFGITLRIDDPVQYLMGQTVLGYHEYDNIQYPAHAFFSDLTGTPPNQQIQIPIADGDLIDQFSQNFRLERRDQPGLSIVIPFPSQELKPHNMIAVGIVNYYYPILTGQLVLQFDDVEINSPNIRDLAKEYATGKITDIDLLFDFIGEVHNTPESDLLVLKDSWIDDNRLFEDDFEPDDLEILRKRFADKEIVGVRLPLTIKKKTGEIHKTGFSVFAKRPDDLSKGQDLYVRGGLTLPGESKFRDRKAFGAMIADEDPIASFLGDAENAAHTRWNSQAEKLRRNYVNPGPKLSVIRNSVVNLYDLLAQSIEEEDELALMKFFWTDLPDQPERPARKGKTKTVFPPPPPPRPRPLVISKFTDGFSIKPTSDAVKDNFPIRCRVRTAYDIISGNPFRKFNSLDFDYTKKDGISVDTTPATVKFAVRGPNILDFNIIDPEFDIKVAGFDPNRDLVVDLRTIEVTE